MKIDLNEIADRTGPEADIAISVVDLLPETIGTKTFTADDFSPFELRCERTKGDVFRICGRTDIRGHMPCDRCLEDTEVKLSIDIDRVCRVSDDTVVEDDDDPLAALSEGILDVCELLKEEILTVLPSKVLCDADCKGLCPVCGKNRNISECDCDRSVLDPRMQKFLDVFKEV